MSSNAANAGGGGLRAARRRRIDEVRQLQQQRRRQVLEPALSEPQQQYQQQEQEPHQQPQHQQQQESERHGQYHMQEETITMRKYQDHHQHQVVGQQQNDANTMASTPARSATSSSTGRSTRSRMSANRQNMMARRIEMRRRVEEREREQHQQQIVAQQQHHAVVVPISPDHPNNSHDHDGQAVHHDDDDGMAQNPSQPQHFHHLPQPILPQQKQRPMSQMPQPQQQQRYNGQSILKNATDNNSSFDVNYSSQQQQHPQAVSPQAEPHPRQRYQQSHAQQQQHPRAGSPHQGQQHYGQSQEQQYHSSQQQHPQDGSPQDGHQQQYQQHNHSQQQHQSRPPINDGQQYHQSRNVSHNTQPLPQQQQPNSQYGTAQSAPQPPPVAIPSPPMLQRRQQFSQIPVYHMGEEEDHQIPPKETEATAQQHRQHNQLSHAGRRINPGVYNEAELEQSGIIRNNGHAPPQNTNRLKNISPYDSPSDEWCGLNGDMQQQSSVKQPLRNQYEQTHRQEQHNQMRQQQSVRNQFEQPAHRQPERNQNQQPQHQQPPRHNDQRGTHDDVGHPGVLKDPSSDGFNAQRNRFSQNRQEQQQFQQYQNQNQPNWNDIDQKYHDDNRQRLYQRQLATRQHQMQQQTLPRQHPQNSHQQQHHASSVSPHRPSRISNLSPVEHLGNRSEHIQRKPFVRNQNQSNPMVTSVVSPNNANDQQHVGGVGGQRTMESGDRQSSLQHRNPPARRQALQQCPPQHPSQSNSYTMEGGEESIVSVSNHARRFQKGSGRRNSHLNTSADSSNIDEETVSVASLRKGWEGKPRAQSAPRSRHPPQASPSRTTTSNQHSESSAFGVWEDRANRLARARRREQRKEQRKNIEDRWRKHTVKSLPPEKRDHKQGGSGGDHDGYQSEGQTRHDDRRDRSDGYRVADGYQSEGPSQRRSHGQVVRGDYHDGYQSEGQEEGQEIEYDDMLENVDSAPITVQDARRRLWDREERLRAVLPEIGSGEIGDVRGRWPDERQPPAGSPSNYSGSSGGLFKSKFVHAAALATRDRVDREQQQQRRENAIEEDKDQELKKQERDYEEQRSRWSQAQRTIASEEEETRERAQRRRFEERQNPRKAQQRQQQQLQNPRQAKHSQQQQQNKEFNSKKSFPQKTEMAASSHYTDSTAETTAVTTPGGSYGSTHLRKVSLSPPKRPAPQQSTASSAMPPIAEQQAAPPLILQKQQPRSVADLIARINAVSRSNPEEALAAIDSILKREGGGGVCDRFVCGDIERMNIPQEATPSTTPSPAAPPPLPPTKTNPRSLFSPSRPEVAPPKITTKKANNVSGHVAAAPVQKQLGKDFFQQSYEEVLRADSERVIHGSALERDCEGDGDDVDEGSLMSSSEDSTVSSMTNPTYQSLRSEQVRRKSLNNTTDLPKNIRRKDHQRSEQGMQARKMFTNPAQPSHLQRNSQQPYQQDLPSKPQKSWNTLRKEYTQRKVPSPTAAQRGNVTTARTPSNDIGVDEFEFNPDDIEVNLGEKNSIKQQPQTVSKTGSNDFVTTGFCGMNYRMAQSSSESKGFGDDYDHDAPPTPSTLTDSAWIPMPTKGNAFSEGKKNNKQRPFTGNGKNNRNRLDMPVLTEQRKNIKAASSQQKRNNQSGSNVLTKQLSNTTAQPSRSVNVPRHIQPSGNNLLMKRSTRPTTPDIMKTVSDAFSDVDISLEEGRNNMEEHALRLIQKTRARPMVDCDDEPQSSLQTISETISNVDVSFDEEKKTAGQRRKDLEYLAKNWTNRKSPSPDVGSKSDTGVRGGSSAFAASLAKVIKRDDAGGGEGGGSTIGSSSWTQPRSLTKAATWANEPQKSTARGATTVKTKYKKVGEPAMRLKGNKSLAKKFASLVKAYDD